MLLIVKDILHYGVARGVPALLSFLIGLMLIEWMTPVGYGEYSLFIATATAISGFAGGMLSQPIMRFGSRYTRLSENLLLYKLPTVLSGVLSLSACAWLYFRGQAFPLVFLPPILLLLTLVDVQRAYFVSRAMPKAIFAVDFGRHSVLLSLIFGLSIFESLRLTWVLLGVLLSLCASFGISLLHHRRIILGNPASIGIHSGGSEFRRAHLVYGLWAAIWLMLIGMMPVIERLAIRETIGDEALGVYATLSDPSAALYSSAASIMLALLIPKIVNAWDSENWTLLRRFILTGIFSVFTTLVLIVAVGVTAIFFALGNLSLAIANNSLLALLVVFSGAVWQAGVFLHKPLEMQLRTRSMLISLLVVFLFFWLLADISIRFAGLHGLVILKITCGLTYSFFVWRTSGR